MDALVTDLRGREFVRRVQWFISIRWLAAAACALVALVVGTGMLPIALSAALFGWTALLLLLSNAFFAVVWRVAILRPLGRSSYENLRHRVTELFVSQILVDFTALSLLIHATGCATSPMILFFLVHVALATLFLRPRLSLGITVGAWAFALLPMLVHSAGAIEVVYGLGMGAAFLAAWYVFSQITNSLKHRENDLAESNERLLALSQAKAKETLRATHELKAPFAAIKSYVYALRDGYCGELPAKAAEVVERIGQRCDRLLDKITDVIHLGNLRTRVLAPDEHRGVDLKWLLERQTQEAALLAQPRSITVTCTCEAADGASFDVRGSKQDLRTLISNLLGNAVQYSRDGSEVHGSLSSSDQAVTLSVRDTGIGIAPAHLGKVFEEHFRTSEAAAHYAHGTGVGLALVKEIVRLHHATIAVSSEPNKGSLFSVTFPRQDST